MAYVTVPEENALDIGYMNKYSLLDLEHISFDIEIIGTNTDMEECCKCTHITSYFLKTNYADYESPLKCGECGRSVPLYKIPLQCPLCSSKWEELSSSEYVDFLCRTCFIATDKE